MPTWQYFFTKAVDSRRKFALDKNGIPNYGQEDVWNKFGQTLQFLHFIGFFKPISLDSQQSLAIQSHGLSTWTTIVWSGPKVGENLTSCDLDIQEIFAG
jgi:hypothetical protein